MVAPPARRKAAERSIAKALPNVENEGKGSFSRMVKMGLEKALSIAMVDQIMTQTQHPDPSSLCCETMQAALELHCTSHDDPFDCPDSLIAYNEAFNQFGLIVHDGGRDVVVIRHCP